MTIKGKHIAHKKICGKHGFTPASRKLVVMLCKIPKVSKVISGKICSYRHCSGRKHAKIFDTVAGLKANIYANSSMHILFISTKEPDFVRKVIESHRL